MKKKAGLWIDHRKAFIVFIEDNKTNTKIIESNVEKQPGRTDGIRNINSDEAQYEKKDNSRERRYHEHMHKYYQEVASVISIADLLYIFGPSQAKLDLKNVLEEQKLGEKIAAIDTEDKMTDNQIVAKVKNFFIKKNGHTE